jgi:hypothetical protein
MKLNTIKIWTLSAFLLVSFTCSYSQQGSADKLRQKKEAKEITKKDVLKEKEQSAVAKKEKLKPKVEKETPQPKKETKANVPKKVKKQWEWNYAKTPKNIHTNTGYAYGKVLDGSEGSDFGQDRATNARLNKESRKTDLTNAVSYGEAQVTEVKAGLVEARSILDQDKGAKRVTETEYQKQKALIDQIEAAINELDAKVKEGASMIAQ